MDEWMNGRMDVWIFDERIHGWRQKRDISLLSFCVTDKSPDNRCLVGDVSSLPLFGTSEVPNFVRAMGRRYSLPIVLPRNWLEGSQRHKGQEESGPNGRRSNTDCQDFCLSRKMTVKKCPFFAVIHEFFHQKFIHPSVHSSIHPFVYLYILTIVLSISSQTVHEKNENLFFYFARTRILLFNWLTHFIIRSFFVSFIQLLVHSFIYFL
jgi:hypothetical protein